MRELSLHILDLIENSIRAGASLICISIEEDHREDLLRIIVEDNGCGLKVSAEAALDPFYTTKNGKRVGLGLSLFQAVAQQAGGGLAVEKSGLGGLKVLVTMRLTNIDRTPLGNLAATISSVVFTNPEIDLRCRFLIDGREDTVSAYEVVRELQNGGFNALVVAKQVSERIKTAMTALQLTD